MNLNSTSKIQIIQAHSTDDLYSTLQYLVKKQEIQVVVLSFENEEMIFISADKILEQIEHFPKPIILQIKNLAKGLMFEILLASHLCIATDSAKFEISNFDKLKKHIGEKKQAKLENIKGEFDAEKALELGIINKICKIENLGQETFELAEQISKNAPVAVEYVLKAVNKGLEMNLEEGLQLESELFSKIFATEDMKEGTNAFFEKRNPNFQGK